MRTATPTRTCTPTRTTGILKGRRREGGLRARPCCAGAPSLLKANGGSGGRTFGLQRAFGPYNLALPFRPLADRGGGRGPAPRARHRSRPRDVVGREGQLLARPARAARGARGRLDSRGLSGRGRRAAPPAARSAGGPDG